MKEVTASAPGKLMLFGDHAVVYGHPCIVTAVDQRITATVRKNGVDIFHLDAPDMGLSAYSRTLADLGKKGTPKAVCFIEHLYKRFLEKHPQQEGIVVTTRSDFSSQFGFGSSSAVTVAFAKALTTLYGVELTNHELFTLCYQAVIDVQGIGSGFDIAAAIWGGTLYYVAPAKTVNPLGGERFELPLAVGYTGIKADTPTLVRMVETQYQAEPERVGSIFADIHQIVDDAQQAIVAQDWQKVGQLMTKNQELLQQLNVSGVQLDELIQASVESGSYGAKLSGAGGGDCMIAVAEPDRQKIESALEAAGGQVMHVKLHAEGVRIES
ncbi:mevalonate kinase [Patescibacteria group bacterium]|nr:mevalonate kinase [Patescibacteria group bacterium]